MSMNKYMHPRNIYKSPPNFKELALEFPEFKPFVKQEISGKVLVDFKNLDTLRALSCTLLKKDFGLTVEIPLSKLIPTIPLRLNYILWIEDLLEIITKSDTIIGIDIGTGASCVYPLLAAKKNKWSMVATEKDLESFTCAKNNVERNNLQSLIHVVLVKGDDLLEDVIEDKYYDFCMCNPPFFSSPHELHPFFKSRKTTRPHPKNAFCATINEVVSKGGEVEFITKLIYESKHLSNRIKIFSTMIGHKCNIPPLKKLLREVNVSSFKESEFCQGNTTRWGLAWTFYQEFDLKRVVDPIKQICKSSKPKKPIIYPLTSSVDNDSVSNIHEKLLHLFDELQMVIERINRYDQMPQYFLIASSNTWSHQRRKRREKTKHNMVDLCNNETSHLRDYVPPLESNDMDVDVEVKSPGKRMPDDSVNSTSLKKLKIVNEEGETTDFFKFMATLKIEGEGLYLELNCVEESGNREYLYQILQYVKNNLNFPTNCT